MDTPTLDTIPADVIRQLSFYLPEKDLDALSLSCIFIYDVLNVNSVWKRFLTKRVRDLLSQNQQIDPPFVPDPDMCENHRLVLMKNHLIGNWRNEKWVEYSTETNYKYASGVLNIPKGSGQLIYKENYIFLGRFTNDIHSDAIEVWDISKEPVLLSAIPMEDIEYDSFYVIENTVVVVVCSRVDVYEINIESKEFPLLYSYLITEDEVVWSKPAFHVGRHNMRCVGWRHYKVGNYLVSSKCDNESYYPVLHVWDIPNACKVGAFVSPVEGFSLQVIHFENSDWYLYLKRQKLYYFKFNVRSKKFSEIVFEYDGSHPSHVLFHKDQLILFKNAEDTDSEGWYDSVCEVYDLNNSTKLQERRFDNAHKNYLLKSTTIVEDKFVLLCKGNFLVVDSTTLATVDSIPYESNVCFIRNQFNVFGTVFVVTREENYREHFWDIEKKKKVSIPIKGGYNCHLYLNKSRTRLVICRYYEMFVMHFW